jgi:hypothetical protein
MISFRIYSRTKDKCEKNMFWFVVNRTIKTNTMKNALATNKNCFFAPYLLKFLVKIIDKKNHETMIHSPRPIYSYLEKSFVYDIFDNSDFEVANMPVILRTLNGKTRLKINL